MGKLCSQADKLVLLAEGEIEVEIEGKAYRPRNWKEVLIPANASHTFRISREKMFGIMDKNG